VDITCLPSSFNGKVRAISSKSYVHRLLICLALAKNDAKIKYDSSADITATKNCLDKLFLDDKVKVLDVGESGSTLRFLLPLSLAVGGSYEFICHGKLLSRPISGLTDVLSTHGAKIKIDDTIKASGKLTPGDYQIAGDVSSQYITGLLFALSILNGKSTITLTTKLTSKPYVDITLKLMQDFGVNVIATTTGYEINGNANYIAPKDIDVDGDWSNASFMLVGGAISNKCTVTGLNLDSTQGDKVILDVLKSAGAKVDINPDGITVQKDKLNAFTFDANDYPDAVPIVSVLASACNGVSVIKNIQRLTLKESDRVQSVLDMLSAVNIVAKRVDDDIVIKGGSPTGGVIDSYNDHRIVMSSAILSLISNSSVKILGANAVNKSYPTFFEDFTFLGGKVKKDV
jgi:3-phosphoshikimate 1-carboxyvinyltransferase